jgi:hypothetical protein
MLPDEDLTEEAAEHEGEVVGGFTAELALVLAVEEVGDLFDSPNVCRTVAEIAPEDQPAEADCVVRSACGFLGEPHIRREP